MSETLVLGIKYIVTWVAQPGACKNCLAWNGQVREIDDLELVPIVFAAVRHPNCRCEVTVEIEVNPEELEIW
jgi:hypothetical protein